MRPGTFTAKKLGTCPKAIDAPAPRKILLPREGLEELGRRKVVWSDLDGNGHVYSGNYGDFVWDYLPADLQEKLPREFFINYSKEATLGQELRLVGFRRDNEYLVEGVGRRGSASPPSACFKMRPEELSLRGVPALSWADPAGGAFSISTARAGIRRRPRPLPPRRRTPGGRP